MRNGRALLLDGRRDDTAAMTAAHDALCDALTASGWHVEDRTLRDDDISFCTGCFGCWLRTPGVCVGRGAARTLAERFMAADLVILLTPVTFGGYSAELKKAMDHLLPILLPNFRKVDGDTRHKMRYERYPDLLAVGVADADGPAAEDEAETFRALVARNVLNMTPPAWAAGVMPADASELEIRARVSGLLGQVGITGAPTDAERASTPRQTSVHSYSTITEVAS